MDLSSACKALSEVRSIIQEWEKKMPQNANGGTGGSAQGEGALGASESQAHSSHPFPSDAAISFTAAVTGAAGTGVI